MKFSRIVLFACSLVAGFQVEIPSSYNQTTVAVNGKQYHYIDEGPRDGRVVVFLHGFPESWFMFKHQIKRVIDLGYRAVALDMLGYGQSDAPESLEQYTYQSITEDIRELLFQSVGAKSALFLGHDWGSIFMWNLATQYPQIVDGLISIAIPIFEPAGIDYKPKDNEVPEVQYQVSIGNLNTTKYDTNIKEFLSAFLQEDPECLVKMSAATPDVDIVKFSLALPCDQTLAIDNNTLNYMINQFYHSGTKGPINYYRTYELNQKTNQTKPVNIVAPTLYIKPNHQIDFVLSRDANHKLIKNLTEKSVDGGNWNFLSHKEEVNTIIEEWLINNFPPPYHNNIISTYTN